MKRRFYILNKMGKGPGLKHFTQFMIALTDEATAHSTAKKIQNFPPCICAE